MRTLAVAAVSLIQLLGVYAGDQFKSMEAICHENGFESESYTVTTSDDYILSIYRIPGLAQEEKTNTPKPVVLMMHG